MRVTASSEVDRAKPEDVAKYTSQVLEQIVQVVNGKLGFADNFDAKILSITFSAANVDVASIHGLGRAPSYYVVLGSTVATTLYDGSSANTTSLLYLRASVAGTVRVLVM
jgi:hypothetical protein